MRHPIIKTASEHLKNANISGCFEAIQHLIPDALRSNYNDLQKRFSSGSAPHDFYQQVAVFLQLLDEDLPAAATTSRESGSPQPIEILQADLSHCLRPDFTRTILRELFVRPKSINLTSGEDIARMRQLEDLQHIAHAHQIRTALINLKDFRLRFEDFLIEMASQLGLSQLNYVLFEDLLHGIHTELVGEQCLIMIANLEVLNDYQSNDERYNAHFVASLNHLKNKESIRLLCSSKEWLKTVVFNGETSILALHPLEMPTTLYDIDIDAEIRRRCPDGMDVRHCEQLRYQLRNTTSPAGLLEYLLNKAVSHYHAPFFNKQLKEWTASYGK